jgi:hypothetical protein
MNSISEDTPRIFRNDDGGLLSPVAPVLAVSVEKQSSRSKFNIPPGQYSDYLSFADIQQKQQIAAQANENKIKHDLYAEALNDGAVTWEDDLPTPAVPQEVWDAIAAQKKAIYEATGFPPAPPAASGGYVQGLIDKDTGQPYHPAPTAEDKAAMDKLISEDDDDWGGIHDYSTGQSAPPAPGHAFDCTCKAGGCGDLKCPCNACYSMAAPPAPGSLPTYQVVEKMEYPPPTLQNKPKVALGEKLKQIIALNSQKKSTPKLDLDKQAEAHPLHVNSWDGPPPDAPPNAFSLKDKAHLLGGWTSPYDPGF